MCYNYLLSKMKKLKFFKKLRLVVLFFAITPIFGGVCYAEILHNHDHDANVIRVSVLESQENIKSGDCLGKDKFLIADVGLERRDFKYVNDQICYVNNFIFFDSVVKKYLLDVFPINSPSPPYQKEMMSSIFKRE